MHLTTRFRQLLAEPKILVMPGVHDALSARAAAEAGFSAITMGGFAATGSLLGQPDSSQLGLRELADHYARVVDASGLPILADADTGFGNVTNVRRAVRAYERAGVAGLFIEDQVFPKRCGHTPGKAVVAVEEMLAKLKAALDARQDPDFVIMARTDARAVVGLDEAIERACLFREAGADLLFVEAPQTIDEMRRVCREVGGLQLANMVEFGHSPELPAKDLQEIGFATCVWPVSSVFTMVHALRVLYQAIARDGTSAAVREQMVSFDDYMRLVGLPDLRDREQSYLDAGVQIIDQAKEPGDKKRSA
jgi:2,3-dimethylmalate lyase